MVVRKDRYVYVIASAVGVTKIGVANSPKFRLAGMQSGSPVPLSLFNSIKVPHLLAQQVEARCHKKLAEFHSHGEWFKVSPDIAWKCVQECSRSTMKWAADRRDYEDWLSDRIVEAITKK